MSILFEKNNRNDLLIIFIVALLWLPGFNGASFLSDDFVHIANWGMAPASKITEWFYNEYAGFYRPMTALLWKTNFAVWGLSPLGYQLTNWLLHLSITIGVWYLAKQISPTNDKAPLWSALFFCYLPGHIFGVLMIAALTGLLCSLLYIISVCCYLHSREGSLKAEIASLLCFVLAILTKELALSLPLLILTWEAILLAYRHSFSLRRWLRISLPYLSILLIYIGIRYLAFGQMPHSAFHENHNPLNLITNVGIYAAQLFSPWGLESLKPILRAYSSWLPVLVLSGLFVAVLLLKACYRSIRPIHLLSLVWIGIALSPTIRLYSPWNTYLPAVGSALLIGHLFNLCCSQWNNRTQVCIRIGRYLFFVISVIYILQHQQHWSQTRLLCKTIVTGIKNTEWQSSSPLLLANLSAEWNGVPLLVGDWALDGALDIEQAPARVIALSNVIKSNRREAIGITQTSPQILQLKLISNDEFFRLETADIISKRILPHIGYTYEKRNIHITVLGLNSQGQANHIEIDLGDPKRMRQVVTWNGNQIVRWEGP